MPQTVTEASTTQASVFLNDFTFRRFLEDCYSENRRRMDAFEPDLLRPSFLPQLAETALGALRLWSFRANDSWRASPMTYMVDGRQYVAAMDSTNLFSFALPN